MAPALSPPAARVLLSCWLSQLLLAIGVGLLAPIPVRPLLIEGRFCSDAQWAERLGRYRSLVLRDRLGIERFRPVIQYSVFGVRQTATLPAAADLVRAGAVGEQDSPEGVALRDHHPTALLLSCRQGLGEAP